jgi:phosphoglycolate phosphatase
MTLKLAVFDCDGTLVDGQGAVVTAMEEAFAASGLPVPDAGAVRRIVGLSLPQAVMRLAPQADAEQVRLAVAEYKQSYRAARASGQLSEPLFDGIPAVLAGLEAAGWTLGVATGKSLRGLTHCLASHGLSRHFITLQTADHHPSKPHPAMLEAAMAVAAGVRPVGVAWGYHSAAELVAAGAVHVADTPLDLLEYLTNG